MNHHRLENVQLKISLGAGEPDGRIVSHNLRRDHSHGLGLCGIHFARHD